jgi:glycosyltransferase involved in cell wall biosynthesis
MLISIVIPTHNRLHLLRDAIETVRRQEGGEWELVIFDNASVDPIREHVASLNDSRVRYARSDEFLPVTSSWNRAISLATGQYVVLLGDDDGLTPRYFERLTRIIREFNEPDVVYNNIYQFWHPGVAPWEPSGYLIDVRHGFFFADRDKPFLLSSDEARFAALGSIRFKINFSFNSQAIVYKREFLAKLSSDGPVYRSPFPDYYIANVALMRSGSTVVLPEPLAVAGVSKASFGFTMYNDQDARGAALLNTDLASDGIYKDVEPFVLPGPAYNTNCLVAMEYVARALPQLGEHVDFGRYRRIQLFATLEAVTSGKVAADVWRDLVKRLSIAERMWAFYVRQILHLSKRSSFAKSRVLPMVQKSVSMIGSHPMVRHCGKHDLNRVTDLYDAFLSGALS